MVKLMSPEYFLIFPNHTVLEILIFPISEKAIIDLMESQFLDTFSDNKTLMYC